MVFDVFVTEVDSPDTVITMSAIARYVSPGTASSIPLMFADRASSVTVHDFMEVHFDAVFLWMDRVILHMSAPAFPTSLAVAMTAPSTTFILQVATRMAGGRGLSSPRMLALR